MTYQEWCIETINVILKMEELDESQYGYKMLIKDIVRHYPEVFMDDGEQIHFWARHVSETCMRSFKRSFVESLIMTRQAHDVIEGGTVKDVHDNLYQEHITPVQYVFEKLKKLRDQNRISAEEIRNCMAQNKLVLLHRSEKSVLDGKRFTKDDFTCLERIIKEVSQKHINVEAELDEARNLIDKSSTYRGSGLFRVCKLLAAGIKFVDVKGEECSNKHLVECLTRDLIEYTT